MYGRSGRTFEPGSKRLIKSIIGADCIKSIHHLCGSQVPHWVLPVLSRRNSVTRIVSLTVRETSWKMSRIDGILVHENLNGEYRSRFLSKCPENGYQAPPDVCRREFLHKHRCRGNQVPVPRQRT